jgi:hypothetical protein
MKIDTYTDNAVALLTLLGGNGTFFDAYCSADPLQYFLCDRLTENAHYEDWQALIR